MEAHAAVVACGVTITLPFRCLSRIRVELIVADKGADSVQSLWGSPVKIGLAKVQYLDATHTLEVELYF